MGKLLTLFGILTPVFIFAQENEGSVIYEATTKIEINFEGDADMENIKSMLPSSHTVKKQLLFNQSATLYSSYDGDEDEDSGPIQLAGESSTIVFKMEMSRPNNKVYRWLADGLVIEKREFMGKNFLISDSKKTPWKLTGEKKTILDYSVQQAIWDDSTRTIVAWFTPQIPISSGPENYGGLPGLIMEVDIDNGRQVVTATEIKYYLVAKAEMKVPNKGKEVTREEFKAIMAEKMEEMKEMGGGNRFIIKSRH